MRLIALNFKNISFFFKNISLQTYLKGFIFKIVSFIFHPKGFILKKEALKFNKVSLNFRLESLIINQLSLKNQAFLFTIGTFDDADFFGYRSAANAATVVGYGGNRVSSGLFAR